MEKQTQQDQQNKKIKSNLDEDLLENLDIEQFDRLKKALDRLGMEENITKVKDLKIKNE